MVFLLYYFLFDRNPANEDLDFFPGVATLEEAKCREYSHVTTYYSALVFFIFLQKTKSSLKKITHSIKRNTICYCVSE